MIPRDFAICMCGEPNPVAGHPCRFDAPTVGGPVKPGLYVSIVPGFSLPWRWLNRLYAAVSGYFWLPCRVCGREFGGHEQSIVLYETTTSGRAACMRCAAEVARRNAVLFGRSPAEAAS